MSEYFIFLNTKDAIDSTKPHDAEWRLRLNKHTENWLMFIESVSFPNAVYPVNSNYNTVIVTDAGGTDTITLTSQIYTGNQIATELQTQLNASGTLTDTYAVSYDAQTLKLTISATSFSIDGGTALDILGFQTTSLGASYTGSNPVRLDGSQYVDFVCSVGRSSYASNEKTNTFFRIPLTTKINSMIYYESKTKHGIKVQDSSLSSFNIRLYDDKDNSWELPANCPVNITIRLISI